MLLPGVLFLAALVYDNLYFFECAGGVLYVSRLFCKKTGENVHSRLAKRVETTE